MVTLLLLLACTGKDPTGDGTPRADDTATSSDTDGDGGDSGEDTTTGSTDADGDGYAADLDCDDTDATIHPGATDACDGVDRDCDGAVVEEGGCGQVTEIADTSVMAIHRDYGYFDIDAVWTPTGGDVVVDQTALEGWSWGGFAVYRWDGDAFGYALSLTTASYEIYQHPTVIGDFDGDGADDLAIHGGSAEGEYVAELALVSGDETRWPAGLTRVDDAAFAVWTGVQGGDGFSEDLDAGDVDGDGLVDIVTHAPLDIGDEYSGKSGWLFVIPGRTGGFPSADDTEAVREEWSYPHSLDHADDTPVDEAFAIEAVHADLDGDGLADVLGNGPGASYVVIPGANLVSMRGAYIEDLIEAQSPDTGRGLLALDLGACGDFDFDGDGVDDCLFLSSDDGDGIVGIVSGESLAAGADPREAALTMAGPLGNGNVHAIRDLDGDGLPDVEYSPDAGTECIIASSRLPLGGTLAAEDIAPCWFHSDEEGFLADVAVGDFDASGVPDVLLPQRPHEWGTLPMYMLRDLVLPWDDPTRW